MSPKSLLKQVFRNILHQKSVESMQSPHVNNPLYNRELGLHQSCAGGFRPQRSQRAFYNDDQSTLASIEEEANYPPSLVLRCKHD